MGHCERYDIDADLTQKRSENTQKIRKSRIIDDSKILHCFFAELCSVNETEYLFKDIRTKEHKDMKRRIIYVGTLIDLAAMFEPDMEAESIEVTNIIKYKSYE